MLLTGCQALQAVVMEKYVILELSAQLQQCLWLWSNSLMQTMLDCDLLELHLCQDFQSLFHLVENPGLHHQHLFATVAGGHVQHKQDELFAKLQASIIAGLQKAVKGIQGELHAEGNGGFLWPPSTTADM